MDGFEPSRLLIEEKALDYELGKQIMNYFRARNIKIEIIRSHNRIRGITAQNPQQGYLEAKNTLVVGVRKSDKFQTCKPSAYYQLPLVTSCPGKCEYCYLHTTLGKRPYLRVYVNVDEILDRARKYIEERQPDVTVFEGAATSDPVPLEYLTGALAQAITFFGQEKSGRFRFVTKFTEIDSLLALEHNGHTTIRFSINSSYVVDNFEHGTPSIARRIEAAGRVARSAYPLGFIIGPIIIYPDWQKDYAMLLSGLKGVLSSERMITFELITHRFTAKAKKNILELFPKTRVPLEEKDRQLKYGQFGYPKYVYPPPTMDEIKRFFVAKIAQYFPQAEIVYFI